VVGVVHLVLPKDRVLGSTCQRKASLDVLPLGSSIKSRALDCCFRGRSLKHESQVTMIILQE
jgi:hypothetical protein